ncbi:FadR/GntR family transcriptional regulator [uncultured Microbacterium sp.]|uniref:FadR/GntR family transcriptional regulator n=1 Tax=uncultured Microbacterium sp. TaxID=191216 RepID=UPI00374A7CAA
MPHSTDGGDHARSVVFAPIEPAGRAELVEQRLTDAIVSGMLRDGERLPSESELSRSLGVALVTAREALEGMRNRGLVRTRRGRDGGSFVTYDRDAAGALARERLRGQSRVALRDLALIVSAVTGLAAELAADRASDDDIETLEAIHHSADLSSADSARRALGRFLFELAAVSQSPRLLHEEARLQAEAGPVLWLCLREEEYRERSSRVRADIIDAIRAVDPDGARTSMRGFIADALDWLLEEKARLDCIPDDGGEHEVDASTTADTAREGMENER